MRHVLALLILTTLTTTGENTARAADDFADVRREIATRHDEAVKRLQDWIALPSIAAESLNSADGRGAHGAARARRRLPEGDDRAHRRQARRVRDARRRRGEDGRPLLHVRRQAVRPGGVDVAAARGAHRRQAGLRQGDRRPRRGEPEGTRGGVPRGAARDPRRRQEAAGEPRAGRRGRGGDRLAAHRADRPPAGGRGGAAQAASASSCPRRRRTPTASSR